MIWAFCINSLIFGNNIAKGGLHYEEDQSIFDDIYGCNHSFVHLYVLSCILSKWKEGQPQGSSFSDNNNSWKKTDQSSQKVKATYSLKILDGSLAVINNKTKEVFEYTDMKKENLPADIKNMLKENFIFENREEVYHFLESYSS